MEALKVDESLNIFRQVGAMLLLLLLVHSIKPSVSSKIAVTEHYH